MLAHTFSSFVANGRCAASGRYELFRAPTKLLLCSSLLSWRPFNMRVIEYFFLPKENFGSFHCIICANLDACLCFHIHNPQTHTLVFRLFICLLVICFLVPLSTHPVCQGLYANCVITYQTQMTLFFLWLLLPSGPHASVIHSFPKLPTGMLQIVNQCSATQKSFIAFHLGMGLHRMLKLWVCLIWHRIRKASNGGEMVPPQECRR